MNRIRAMASTVILAGGTLLLAPAPAHSTYLDPIDLLPKRCCGGDVDGDGKPDFQCCTRDPAGCSAGPDGCVIHQT